MTSSPASSGSSRATSPGITTTRDEPHRRTRARMRDMRLADVEWVSAESRFASTEGPCITKVNTLRSFRDSRGENGADFRRQAPRPPADLGRHGPLHDDRDGPAREPPEDAPSGEP